MMYSIEKDKIYFIARESDTILIYAYKFMNNERELTFSFEEFKSETKFCYTKSNFLNSLNYLEAIKMIIKLNFDRWDDSTDEFKINIPHSSFKYIEEIILKN